MLNLNLPKYKYLLKNENGKLYIYDNIRKMDVVLTPEEWVRQHFVNYLINFKKYPKSMISLESGMKYNKLLKRTDIIVYSRKSIPLILIECKAPSISINKKTLFQLGTYNSKIKSEYLVVTNGMVSYCWKKQENNYKRLDELPEYSSIN
ncbi:MAG: type I restriction enzyme HsdR N-terminal domain-containing protein [Bacteroidota bacterium]|nr:type I restriction enzyme HsdR N-terminal domain-containing protein [Bacteroidota bacterium]